MFNDGTRTLVFRGESTGFAWSDDVNCEADDIDLNGDQPLVFNVYAQSNYQRYSVAVTGSYNPDQKYWSIDVSSSPGGKLPPWAMCWESDAESAILKLTVPSDAVIEATTNAQNAQVRRISPVYSTDGDNH